jgi:hypothetical protein
MWGGYEYFLEAVRNPEHDEHRLVPWLAAPESAEYQAPCPPPSPEVIIRPSFMPTALGGPSTTPPALLTELCLDRFSIFFYFGRGNSARSLKWE